MSRSIVDIEGWSTVMGRGRGGQWQCATSGDDGGEKPWNTKKKKWKPVFGLLEFQSAEPLFLEPRRRHLMISSPNHGNDGDDLFQITNTYKKKKERENIRRLWQATIGYPRLVSTTVNPNDNDNSGWPWGSGDQKSHGWDHPKKMMMMILTVGPGSDVSNIIESDDRLSPFGPSNRHATSCTNGEGFCKGCR